MSWSEYLVNTLSPLPKPFSSSTKTRTVITPLDEEEIGDEQDQNEEQDYPQDQNEEQDYPQDQNEEQDYPQAPIEQEMKQFLTQEKPKLGLIDKFKSKDTENQYLLELLNTVGELRKEISKVQSEVRNPKSEQPINIHTIINPPLSFPETSRIDITSPSGIRLVEFHTRNLKFSGKKNDMSINDFLRAGTRLNLALNLNEKDFLTILSTRTTDSARSMFEYWIGLGYNSKHLFNVAYATWNSEVSCQKAVMLLGSYNIPKAFTISECIADISHLGMVASMSGLDESARNSIRETNVLNALLTRLPKECKKIIENQYIRLSQLHGRVPTVLELTLSLVPYHSILNDEIGACSTYNYAPKRAVFDICKIGSSEIAANSGKPKPFKKFGNKSVRALNLNAISTSRGETTQDHSRGTPSHTYNVNLISEMHPNLPTHHIFALNEGRKYNTKGVQGKGKKYCTFCSGSNHGSEAGCYSMMNDSLRHVYATPSMKACETCLTKLDKKLHHSSKLCPIRPFMLESYRKGLVKPLGIFKSYVEKTHSTSK
jgi:hypothetical protein